MGKTRPAPWSARWLVVLLAALVVAGWIWSAPKAVGADEGSGVSGVHTAPSGTPKHGGSMTILLSSGLTGAWTNLDPGTSTGAAANAGMLDAIFGGLFVQRANGQIAPDLATGYKYSNGGTTFTLTLRKGVTFSDGTPFDAQAVVFNFHRDLTSPTCQCQSNFPISGMTTPNADTVVLQLPHPFAPLIDAFPGEALNWIVSPTSLRKLGESAFEAKPVGAGPFVVASDTINTKLVLKRNPRYWEKGLPYLDGITFLPIGSDNSAYDALLVNQAQVYSGYGEYTTINQVAKKVNVYTAPGLNPDAINFNTTKPPFNNILAREAVAYATNPQAINKALFAGQGTLTQSPTGPGGLFYEPTVPGTRTYDLAKAKSLVKQLGGLNFTLDSMNGLQVEELDTALQTQWQAAGMKVTLVPNNLLPFVQDHTSNKWDAAIINPGSYDPAVGFGLTFDFTSSGILSGDRDPTLDAMIEHATLSLDQTTRATEYKSIFKYINDHVYQVGLFNPPIYLLTTKKVTWAKNGPGLIAPPLTAYYETLAYTK